MATLSVPEIQEILKGKKSVHAKELRNATKHDERTTFHTQPSAERTDLKYLPAFQDYVKKILNKDKYEVFDHLLTLPLPTVEIVNGIMDELQKVFEASNRFMKFQFDNPELENDFNDYRTKIQDNAWWQTVGFNVMKSDVNSFMIVDLPVTQESERPEPYYFTITPDKVIDLKIKRDGSLEYIVFMDEENYYCFDDKFYRSFSKEGVLKTESAHNLGYTPAMSFWSTPYNNKSKVMKRNPITNSLAAIDWLLYSVTAKKHLSTYAGFPIFVAYEQKCTFEDELGNRCEGGKITKIVNTGGEGGSVKKVITDCPSCAESRKVMGAGTFLKAPAPRDKEDPILLEGVKIIPADTNSLDWMQKDVDGQISWITYNVIGVPDEITSMAINEKQVVTQFESRINVLMNVKLNFEKIHKWTIDTVARLRYGEVFKESVLSYGDKFFLYTADKIEEGYGEAKTAGAPMYELAEKRKKIYEARYKNNHEMLERMEILSEIEPYPDMSLKELTELSAKYTIDEKLIHLKANFDNYVLRFERENVPVNMFMQFNEKYEKINIIKEKLLEYVQEDLDAMQEQKDAEAAEQLAKMQAASGQPPVPGKPGEQPPKPGEQPPVPPKPGEEDDDEGDDE